MKEQYKKYDVNFLTQSADAGGSMPLGGFDVGCNVWVENDVLMLYFQQNGGFDENNSLLKQGRLSISFSEKIFEDGFSQRLNIYDGNIVIKGQKGSLETRILLWASRFSPAVHIEVQSSDEIGVTAVYENWRTADRPVDSRDFELFQCKEVWGYPGEVIFHKDKIEPAKNEILFYHQNDNQDLSFDKEMDAQGLGQVKRDMYNPLKDLISGGLLRIPGMNYRGKTSGKYCETDFEGHVYSSEIETKAHNIDIFLHPDTGPYAAVWENQLRLGIRTDTLEQTVEDWHKYWGKSFIFMSGSEDNVYWRIGRNYQLFRYMQGCNEKSVLPNKFNGGMFTYDPSLAILGSKIAPRHMCEDYDSWTNRDKKYAYTPDYRRWSGGTYTIQNQRWLYWHMLKSGDFEMMPQLFDFFVRLLPNEKIRTGAQLCIDGAIYPEQLNSYGLCCTCDHGWENTTGLPVEQIRYLFSNPLEIGLMILEYNRFTGEDISKYIDFIDSVVKVYHNFYKSDDINGKMMMYPGNALETYHPVRNPIDGIAALMCLLPRLLDLPEKHTTVEQKELWTEIFYRIPPISYDEAGDKKVIKYAETESVIHNAELPQMYAVFPYEIFGIGKPGLDTARNTAVLSVEDPQQTDVISWQHMGVHYARLGMKPEALAFLERKMDDSGRRFPAFWGAGWDWTPDFNWGGSGSFQLQEMLMQTIENNIYLFPCWDKSIDVSFKLHAPRNTVVECTLENGRIKSLDVTPSYREKDVKILLYGEADYENT